MVTQSAYEFEIIEMCNHGRGVAVFFETVVE
jgi:hypothetical protein